MFVSCLPQHFCGKEIAFSFKLLLVEMLFVEMLLVEMLFVEMLFVEMLLVEMHIGGEENWYFKTADRPATSSASLNASLLAKKSLKNQ